MAINTKVKQGQVWVHRNGRQIQVLEATTQYQQFWADPRYPHGSARVVTLRNGRRHGPDRRIGLTATGKIKGYKLSTIKGAR